MNAKTQHMTHNTQAAQPFVIAACRHTHTQGVHGESIQLYGHTEALQSLDTARTHFQHECKYKTHTHTNAWTHTHKHALTRSRLVMAWQHADTDTCCGNLSRAWTSPGTTGIRCAPGRQPTGRRSRMRRTCRTWSPTGEGKTVCVSPRLSSLLFRLSSSHLSPPSLLLSSHLISHLLSLLSLSLHHHSLQTVWWTHRNSRKAQLAHSPTGIGAAVGDGELSGEEVRARSNFLHSFYYFFSVYSFCLIHSFHSFF